MSEIHRRVGCFKMSSDVLRNFADALALLDNCIVLGTVNREDEIEYWAIHPDFEPVSEDCGMIYYKPILSGGKRTWERVD